MEQHAPAVLQALEASALGAAIRQSTWVYGSANVAHVAAVVVFAGAVAIMDVRLLGAFAAIPAGQVLRQVRRVAVAAFCAILLSGAVLFIAEASHVALNPVFQIKVVLIGLALINVLVFEVAFRRQLAEIPPQTPLPARVRTSAFVSLACWFAAAVCGRSIAYF